MPYPIHLRIQPQDDGSWRITLDQRGLRPTEGTLPAEHVSTILRSAEALLSPEALPVVLLPGADADRTAAEEEVGRVLSRVLHATPEIAQNLAWQLGAAQGRNERAVLVVDAEAPGVRRLPWELLAGSTGQALEIQHHALVARMSPGHSGWSPSENANQLEVMTWCPDPDDPVSAALLETITNLTDQLGLGRPRVMEPDGTLPEADRDRPARLLHVVSHGRSAREQVELLVGSDDEGRVGAGTALHLLSPILRQVDLVLLHVCEGGTATDDELASLPARFLSCGAPACIAAINRLGLESSRAFLRALYPTLMSGASLAASVAAGRRAVRLLAMPHPDSRWYNQALFVGDVSVLARERLVEDRWLPEGWAQPGADAAQMLDEAFRVACRTGSGFVGLEHLALALARSASNAPGLEHVRFQFGLRRDHFRDYLAAFVPVATRPADWRGTPRLRSYARQLEPGFSLSDLWQVISRDRRHFLREMVKARLVATSSADTYFTDRTEHSLEWSVPDRNGPPPDALQVLGGPEDGRLIQPAPGDTVGRWSDSGMAEHMLYEQSVLVDRALSRRHLRWVGDGRIELLGRTRGLVRHGIRDNAPDGPFRLEDNDILQLSRATWLRAVSTARGT